MIRAVVRITNYENREFLWGGEEDGDLIRKFDVKMNRERAWESVVTREREGMRIRNPVLQTSGPD